MIAGPSPTGVDPEAQRVQMRGSDVPSPQSTWAETEPVPELAQVPAARIGCRQRRPWTAPLPLIVLALLSRGGSCSATLLAFAEPSTTRLHVPATKCVLSSTRRTPGV